MSSSSKPYSAALIGVGSTVNSKGQKGGGHQIGYTHATMYKHSPRTNLAAAADINPENLAAFQKRFDVPRGFADYRTMLKEAQPAVVSIATYVGLHRQMIEACARAGVKGIFCEKPFVGSPADLNAVKRIAEETGVKIVIAHVRRYRQAFQRARELYNDGTIGDPVLCAAGISGWDLSEWGSHWLDIFRFFHQDRPINWVMGQARVRDTRGYGHAMEEHALAYFEFEGGGKALLDGGRSLNGKATMTLTGSAGSIRIFDEYRLEIDTAQGRRVEDFSGQPPVNWDGLGLTRNNDWEDLWDVALAELLAWIEGGPVARLGLPNTLPSAELNLAAYMSAVRGDRIDLPLQSELAEWPVEVLARRQKPDGV